MPRFESLAVALSRARPADPKATGKSQAGAAKVRLPFVRHVPLAGWGPFLRFGERTAEEEDENRRLHTRALVLEDPSGERVALVTIDLHGGSRYLTEKAASLLADQGFHPGNLFLCGTHNHAGPGGLYASPYFDGFAASTGIFSGRSRRVGFNQTLADALAARVDEAVRTAVKALKPALIGSSHQQRLHHWSRQRSKAAVRANFPGAVDEEILEHFKDLSGDSTELTRGALDARLQTIAAFHAEGAQELIGSFSTWGAHCAMLSREHEVQSADYFGEAASEAEQRHPDAVIAIAAGSIGDSDPLPPGVKFEELLKLRANWDQNEALVKQQATGLRDGVLEAIKVAAEHKSPLHSISSRFLENQISDAAVEDIRLPVLPQIGIPTIAGSELGTGDIRVGFLVHMREGVRRHDLDDGSESWPRSQSNWDDYLAWLGQRCMGQIGAILSFWTTRPFLAQQHKRLPLRYLELQLEGRKLAVLGMPGEPTTWLAHKLAALTGVPTLVAAVTGDYAGYLTTEAEYAMQQYEGGSTIWGRYTERWLTVQVKKLVSGEGTQRSLDAPTFSVFREPWVTRISGDGGEMTKK